jgi:plastocyanin
MARCVGLLGLGAAALLAGCGGAAAPPASTPTPGSASGSSTTMEMSENTSCAPSGTMLMLIARDNRFNTACLAAPAGQAVTLHLESHDQVPHNVALYSADPDKVKDARELFKGDLVTPPTTSADYRVPAQPAGTYHYHCSVHPTLMFGSYVVK